ncbi:hypothetical protein [Candidatus Ventrimonas sp.]|uniref:hypothetical protein n=1 Tax=Candidatus Ventrimonas sp. TaxID=3048889 RepID=UPI003AB8CF30
MSKIEDKIISAVVGYKVTSISLDLEQMLNLITEHYISAATTDDEYNAIRKTVKGGIFLDKELSSKDNRYQLRSMTGRRVGLFRLKQHNIIWVFDTQENKFYEYCAWSFRKLKKSVNEAIANAKAH